ncbi:hypothetical protein ACFL6D_05545 [Spirochaetota bacterium]
MRALLYYLSGTIFVLLFIVACSNAVDVQVEGFVFNDENKNSIYNTNESFLGDVLIRSGNFEASTADDGTFSISAKVNDTSSEIVIFFTKDGYEDASYTIDRFKTEGDDDSSDAASVYYPVVGNEIISNLEVGMEE